jgi:hypothetical protein
MNYSVSRGEFGSSAPGWTYRLVLQLKLDGFRVDAGAPPPPPPPAGGACGATKTYDACISCCVNAHPGGAKTYNNALAACLCKPGNCRVQCSSSLCASPMADPNGSCNVCAADKYTNCSTDVTTACTADADCNALMQCAVACDKLP